jgi:hypothetical protein
MAEHSMQPTPFAQTFIGAFMVTVLGGIAVLLIQKNLLENGPVVKKEAQSYSFLAPVGVTKRDIIQCVQRNSSQFILGHQYTLEDTKKSFGEILVILHVSDPSLKVLLHSCASTGAN